ncbi:MAG: class I SAM-dependent methyltransferase [Pseudomonadota bacterium]
MKENTSCPLCAQANPSEFHKDAMRKYFLCQKCKLVFVPINQQILLSEEKKHYDRHQNNPMDERYRNFLNKLVKEIKPKLANNSFGLDYGCGSGPTISVMLGEQGHNVSNFDPLYNNNSKLLELSYDFITATEVAEHFKSPQKEFEKLFEMLKPGGYLGLMTNRWTTLESFKTWYYIRDLTHISFFCEETFEYIAKKFNASLEITGSDVAIFQINPLK